MPGKAPRRIVNTVKQNRAKGALLDYSAKVNNYQDDQISESRNESMMGSGLGGVGSSLGNRNLEFGNKIDSTMKK
jgi:hypothetical protein